MPLALALLAGFAVRLWAMQWPPFPIDMNDWIAWGERVLAVGPSRFYSDAIFADYAPGYFYVMWLTAAIKNAVLPGAGNGAYYFLYRLPPMISDLLTGALIFNIVAQVRATALKADRDDVAVPTLAAALYVFNPAIIFNSATWGQIDATFTLGMVLALVLLLRGRPELAVASYVIAFMIKPQAISLAPVIGIVLLLRYTPRRWLSSAAVGIALAYVIAAPFLGLNAFGGLIRLLSKSVATYPCTSLFSYNLWGIVGFWKDDTVRLGAPLVPCRVQMQPTAANAGWSLDTLLTLRSIGTLLYIIGIVYGVIVLVWRLRRSRRDDLTVFFFAVYFTFLPVMVLTRMHERYLYPVLPMLLIFAFVYATYPRTPNRSGVAAYLRNVPFGSYVLLSILHLFNLFQVYVYYQNFDTGVPRSNTLYWLINDNAKLWSGLTLLLFAGVTLNALRWLDDRIVRGPAALAGMDRELAG